jgi:uncharacterized protein YyaL (SSP411 family)
MKQLLFIGVLLALLSPLTAQDPPRPYDPNANAKEEITKAIAQAQLENKHVLLQIGGNWCPWCLKIAKFFNEDQAVDSLLKANFVVVKVNYSKENRNEQLLEELEFPQRFGFPVLVILDQKGNRIHTQNSGYLEQDKGYNQEEILRFLKHWSVAALDPKSYQKQPTK